MRLIKQLIAFQIIWGLFSCSNHESILKKQIGFKLDSLLHTEHQNNHFHGGVVVAYKNEFIYEKYIGYSNRKDSTKISRETKFDIASVNKSFIAALILKAVEDDKLKLDDKLIDLLAPYSYSGKFDPEITLHQMLCHISGLADYAEIPQHFRSDNFRKFKQTHFSNLDYINFISQLPVIDRPNKSFHYSNFSYHLLSIILEKIYQKPFDTILLEQLTKPLGLKNTVAELNSRENIENLAQGYISNGSVQNWEQQIDVDLSLGRRIFSTVGDLNRWGQVMSNPGYLSKKSLEQMQTNHVMDIDKNISYGYGWAIFNDENQGTMGNLHLTRDYIIHGGSTDGYKSMLVNINNSEYVISFLSNHSYANELLLTKKITTILNL